MNYYIYLSGISYNKHRTTGSSPEIEFFDEYGYQVQNLYWKGVEWFEFSELISLPYAQYFLNSYRLIGVWFVKDNQFFSEDKLSSGEHYDISKGTEQNPVRVIMLGYPKSSTFSESLPPISLSLSDDINYTNTNMYDGFPDFRSKTFVCVPNYDFLDRLGSFDAGQPPTYADYLPYIRYVLQYEYGVGDGADPEVLSYSDRSMDITKITYRQVSFASGYTSSGTLQDITEDSVLILPWIDPDMPQPIPEGADLDDYALQLFISVECKLRGGNIGYFQWTNDDDAKIKKGQPISNLTASSYNHYFDLLNACRSAIDVQTVDYSSVKINKGDPITSTAMSNIAYASQGVPDVSYFDPLTEGGGKEFVDAALLSSCKKGDQIRTWIFAHTGIIFNPANSGQSYIDLKVLLNDQIAMYNAPRYRAIMRKKWG